MRDALFRSEEVALEDLAGVGAGEVAGFGHGMEDLWQRGAVDGKVVDRLVRRDGNGRVEGGLGEHGGDCARVGNC